jgi:hypothetical protein
MYQEHSEAFFLCMRNTVRCSSYVTGTQGGGLVCQELIEEVSDIRILLLSVE